MTSYWDERWGDSGEYLEGLWVAYGSFASAAVYDSSPKEAKKVKEAQEALGPSRRPWGLLESPGTLYSSNKV